MGIDKSRPVLITGCSTGIGRATAERLADDGWNVYATARQPESIEDLAGRGCKTLALDVTDEASMERGGRARSRQEAAPIGALVNNAGYSQSGAIETIPMDSVRRQFETNVFGLMRMCQLVLPGHARARARAGSSTSARWAASSPSRAAASTTRPSTRSRRSPTRCASRSRASASTSS